MNSSNRGTVIGLVAVVVIAIGALVYFMSKSGGTATTDTVKELQAEAQRQVPAGIGRPTEAEAHEGLHQMSPGGKQSTAPSPTGGIAPK